MKNLNPHLAVSAIFLCVACPFVIKAQSQPQIQESSVRAPSSIKIDGQLTEWPNPLVLNAYNSANRIYYVVSNDDDNLYFAIRGLGTAVSNKVLKEGVTFTISHSLEKKGRGTDAKNVSITFPMRQQLKTVSYIMDPEFMLASFLRDTIANRKQIDSLVAIANKRVANAMKEIRIINVKEVPDSVISVYNEVGIKAAIQFIKRQPIIEIAIPLKFLGLSIENPAKFSYNIKLNAPPMSVEDDIMDIQKSTSPNVATPDLYYRLTTTDFWGEYILIKKP